MDRFSITWCFTVITGQLPTKEKDDVEDRNQEDSIAITKIVKKDTVENSSESLKTEDDAKSVISHQEIQKKLDGGKGNKGSTYTKYQNGFALIQNIFVIISY